MKDEEIMTPEDYTDPQCPFCADQYKSEQVKSVPIGRIVEKADEYFSRNDYDGAERHLLYWLKEAEIGNDDRGAFAVLNELMGIYRKTGKKQEALDAVVRTLALIEKLGITKEVAGGTAYVNIGTVYKSFDMSGEALPYFEKAVTIYENAEDKDGLIGYYKLGGLYNNMALAQVDLKMFDEAKINYKKALDIVENAPNGELEAAVTYLNMANLAEAEKGLEDAADKIAELLDITEKLLDKEGVPRDGYYAFVCEKCAPTFAYYGYFAFAAELERRAKDIYERS